jgi:hypothetical protein
VIAEHVAGHPQRERLDVEGGQLPPRLRELHVADADCDDLTCRATIAHQGRILGVEGLAQQQGRVVGVLLTEVPEGRAHLDDDVFRRESRVLPVAVGDALDEQG